MIDIKIDKEVLKIDPRLTISRFQKIQRFPDKYKTPTEILSLYLDLEPSELKGLPVDEIKYAQDVITQHLNIEKTNDVVFCFEFQGINYGLENDWGNMTWGQWTDLEVYSQSDIINDNIHIIMALLYRPIKIQNGTKYTLEKFNSDDVMARAEIFKELPVVYWYGASTFFLLMSNQFIKNIQNSLKAMILIEKWMKPVRKILPKWLLPRVPQDFIFKSLSNSQKKMLLESTD